MKTVQMGPKSTFKQRATRFGLGLGLAATLALGAVMPAMAAPDDGVGTANVTAGVNSAIVGTFAFDDGLFAPEAPATPNGVKLTGLVGQVATAAPAITVVDASGSTNGWTVTMSMPNTFTDGAKSFTAAPRITGTTSIDKTVTGVTKSTPSIVGGATVVSAPAGTAGGTYIVTPTITVDIPEDTKIGTYTSTLTVDTATPISE